MKSNVIIIILLIIIVVLLLVLVSPILFFGYTSYKFVETTENVVDNLINPSKSSENDKTTEFSDKVIEWESSDINKLLDNLKLPKEYYHSAKEIINKSDFDMNYYQSGNEYALRGWIVYNKKYSNIIKFNNKTFNSDKDDLEGFYWAIGHIMDCWNTSPAVAEYQPVRDGSFNWVTGESTFYYKSDKSEGMQFVMINDYDDKDNIIFHSVDGKYKACFKQVNL